MPRWAISAAALALTLAAAPPPGASSCSGCHGRAFPLNALPASDIVAAMDEYRAGTKPATVMDRISRGFSHDETVAIAAWWTAQK